MKSENHVYFIMFADQDSDIWSVYKCFVKYT